MTPTSNEQAANQREEWLAEARQTGDSDPQLIKREQSRHNWDAPLEIRALTGDGQVKTYVATARDICATGLQFHCRHDLGLYTQVEVFTCGSNVAVPAVIRHQTQVVNGFLVGAEFCD